MVEMVCIGCPKGCRLCVDVDNDYKVTGNSCNVGAEYGRNELKNPTRVLTTTVRIKNAIHHQLPVHSSAPLPKAMLIEAVKALKDIEVSSPVKVDEVIVKNILDTGIDIVSSRNM